MSNVTKNVTAVTLSKRDRLSRFLQRPYSMSKRDIEVVTLVTDMPVEVEHGLAS